jgi:hypothetical protein
MLKKHASGQVPSVQVGKRRLSKMPCPPVWSGPAHTPHSSDAPGPRSHETRGKKCEWQRCGQHSCDTYTHRQQAIEHEQQERDGGRRARKLVLRQLQRHRRLLRVFPLKHLQACFRISLHSVAVRQPLGGPRRRVVFNLFALSRYLLDLCQGIRHEEQLRDERQRIHAVRLRPTRR